MAKYSRGLPAIQGDLKSLRNLFDLKRDGLGALLCAIGTDGVQDNLAAEITPDGEAFADLSPLYEAYKEAHFPGQPIAVLHHLMADPAQVAGIVRVNSHEAEVTYGVSGEARAEAEWFIEGNERQPPRDFWGLTKEALQRIGETCDARFESKL